MKISSLLAIALLAPGCTVASPTKKDCTTVNEVRSYPESCAQDIIRLKAYLISTRHGEYVVDTPDGTNMLSVEISQSNAKGASELLKKLGLANKGKPFALIYGTFEGRLVIDKRGAPLKFEIYREVQGQGAEVIHPSP